MSSLKIKSWKLYPLLYWTDENGSIVNGGETKRCSRERGRERERERDLERERERSREREREI